MNSKKELLRKKVNDAWNELIELTKMYGSKADCTSRARNYWMGLQVAWDTLFDGEEV